MNKIIRKLITATLALILSAVMVVTVTYAWTTISTAPIVEGIQITIGGGHTILVAPNIAQTVDGQTYNYPGYFGDTLNFTRYDQYDYLTELASLTPVSTADGINWFLPDYYDLNDAEVKNGTAVAGQIKPVEQFIRDSSLQYANISDSVEGVPSGHYVYLDFWVVSPGSDYTLRVSRGDNDGGSFVLELMNPVKTEEGKYTLAETAGGAMASVRIGFLADPAYVSDNTMRYYQNSLVYSDRYTGLKGSVNVDGGEQYSDKCRFVIYEPNGDLHPKGESGVYTVTSPLGFNGESVCFADIRDRLSVQLSSRWKAAGDGGVSLEEVFQVAIAGKDISSVAEASDALYKKYLQGHFASYAVKGSFVKKTEDLYSYSTDDGVVSNAELETLNTAGATDGAYIVKLEKNVPQRIRMFVWIEGQDVDCVNQANTIDFALSVELAGSNQDIYE